MKKNYICDMHEKIKEAFEKEYYVEISTTTGIEELAIKIGISKNTLRRFLGKINSNSQLSATSLNYLAIAIGYEDYQSFLLDDKEIKLEFSSVKIFYESIKNKGVTINDHRFQDVNYQFAKKIIENPQYLNSFFINLSIVHPR